MRFSKRSSSITVQLYLPKDLNQIFSEVSNTSLVLLKAPSSCLIIASSEDSPREKVILLGVSSWTQNPNTSKFTGYFREGEEKKKKGCPSVFITKIGTKKIKRYTKGAGQHVAVIIWMTK